MNDEVMVKFGADLTPVGVGLRKLKDMIRESAHGVQEAFGEIFHHLSGPLTIGGLIVGVEKALIKAQELTRQAETLGVSTNFIQDLRNVAASAGVSGEAVEKMMDKFIKGLPAGSDVEEQFYKIANRIKAISDPAERARLAIEAFGKSGVKFVSVLERGADGIKELGSQFAKFSAEDIKALEESKLALEKFENFFTIWSGRMLIGFQFLGRGIAAAIPAIFNGDKGPLEKFGEWIRNTGNASSHGGAPHEAAGVSDAVLEKYKQHLDDIKLRSESISNAEKLRILNSRRAFEENSVMNAKTADDAYAHLTKVADIEQQILDVKKKQTDEAERNRKKAEEASRAEARRLERLREMETRIADATRASQRSDRNFQQAFSDQSKFSLSELADIGRNKFYSGYGRSETFAERTAIDIQNLENRVRWARDFGNTEFADSLQSRANELRKSIGYAIGAGESDPLQGVRDASEQAATRLAELADLARGRGININTDDNP